MQLNYETLFTVLAGLLSCFRIPLVRDRDRSQYKRIQTDGTLATKMEVPYQMISAGNLRFWMVIPHSRKYMEEHKQKQQKQKSAEASKTISNRFVRVWILTAHRGLQLQSPRLESVVQQTNKLPIGILKTQNTLFNIWQTKVFIKEYLFDTKQGANEFTSVVASSSSSSSSRAVNRYSNNNENGEADEDDEDDVFIYDTIKNWIVRTKTIWQNGDFIDTDNVLLLEDGLPSNEYSDDESDFA